ncbi:DUF6977 family protein [Moraxella lincolnii]|uniref:DarT1-associated NADAR antitoxin family protein n=1 Tax=Lwoffella lincolnii TaxID=90241 RepID=UPI0039843E72
MAKRPTYIPSKDENKLVQVEMIDFIYHSGFAISQKQKSIKSLHQSINERFGFDNILEISSKSENELGLALSAFNLMITTKIKGRTFSVESAFQSSKVFEGGIQYLDLLDKPSREAKKDPRLKSSGNIISFNFYNQLWQTTPLTAFYDWLYVNALKNKKNKPEYHDKLLKYQAFTDIEFNPEKSINCQAQSVALFCSLCEKGILEQATLSQENFLALYQDYQIDNSYKKLKDNSQGALL